MSGMRAACAALGLSAMLACDGEIGPGIELGYDGPVADWPVYAGAGSIHFSPLTQIDPGNVAGLEVAWTHRSGDFFDGSGRSAVTAGQATPLVANDTLYYCTPFMRVFALDPASGAFVSSQ